MATIYAHSPECDRWVPIEPHRDWRDMVNGTWTPHEVLHLVHLEQFGPKPAKPETILEL